MKVSGTLGGTLTLDSVSENATTSAGSVPWTYTVANSATQYLAKDETTSEVFTVTIDDGKGGEVTQDVTITIIGTNDVPVIDAIATTALTEKTNSDALTATIPVTFTDVDLTDIGHTARITGVAATGITTGLALNQDALRALVSLGSVTKDSASSAGALDMNFSASSTALDYLAKDEVLTLTYTVEVNDGDGGITSQTFAVNITGTNDIPMLIGVGQDISGVDYCRVLKPEHDIFFNFDFNDFKHEDLLRYSPQLVYIVSSLINVTLRKRGA
jgi:VCBS repeat-containing protein